MQYEPYNGPYTMQPSNIPGMFKTKPFGTYRAPIVQEIIRARVNSQVEFADYILEARKNLPPSTLKIRLNKILFKINYHFRRIFK